MIDRSLWPEIIRQNEANKYFDLTVQNVSKRVSLGKFAPRYKGAMGFYFKSSEITDEHIRPVRQAHKCPECGASLHQRALNKQIGKAYYACSACDYRCKNDIGVEKKIAPLRELKYPRFLACECGGRVYKSSHDKTRSYRYGKCRSCNTVYKQFVETGEMIKSFKRVASTEPKPRKVRTPKPPKPKVEKMAKTIRQDYTEKLKDIRDRKARELSGNAIVTDSKAIAQKKRLDDLKHKRELQEIAKADLW